MSWDEARFWLEAARFLLIPALAYVAWAVRDIRRQLGEQLMRTQRLEDFRESHETWCGERNDRNEREHGEMQSAIHINRESVHTLRNDTMRELLKVQQER